MAYVKATTGELITENSTPNLDDWGWDDFWTCVDWINWHKVMKAKKGKEYADSQMILWYGKQTNFAHALDCRSFNSAFRDYFRKEGILSSLENIITKPLGAATDLVSAGSNVVSNVGRGAENVSKVLRIGIPILIGVFGVIGIMYAYKKFVKK